MPLRRVRAPALGIVLLLVLAVLILVDLARPTSFVRELFRPGPPQRGLDVLRDDLREEFRERGPTRPLPLPR